ncbi:SHOCT domain-containing protein [Blastococcus atacamensis]|uniref:SHOCT domain-containing protein n=1 Tax=Blastococcus atacamensis TaxID=2070508 RepID=UPI000CECB817|nr:hypothetical protein [Blastococcus atacamensis]
MMFWTDHSPTAWDWLTMTVSMLLFWALLITLTGVLVREPTRPARHGHATTATPDRLLAERFARGEIDEGEYRRRLATLTRSGQEPPTP